MGLSNEETYRIINICNNRLASEENACRFDVDKELIDKIIYQIENTPVVRQEVINNAKGIIMANKVVCSKKIAERLLFTLILNRLR